MNRSKSPTKCPCYEYCKEIRRKAQKTMSKPEVSKKLPVLPNSENHMYGWLVNNPETKLEIYGPDILPKPPLLPPDLYD